MKSRLNRLANALLVLLPAIATAGCWELEDRHRTAQTPAFPLVIPPEDLDLGLVWASPALVRELRLRNVSSQPVEVTDLKVSCACFQVKFSPMTIAPGEFGQIRITLDLSRLGGFAETGEKKNFRTQLIPVVKGYSGRPIPSELTGTVRQLLRASTSFVEFEEPWCLGDSAPVRSVDVASAVPLASLRAETDHPDICCEIVRQGPLQYILQIRPSEQVCPGVFMGSVKLFAELTSGTLIECGHVTAKGHAIGEIETLPYVVDWGLVPVGQTRKCRVVVRSRIKTSFQIESITSDSEHIEVRTEHPGGNVLLLKHKIVAAGRNRNEIRIEVRNHQGASRSLVVPICFSGV